MEEIKQSGRDYLKFILIPAFFLLVLIFTTHKYYSVDVWWHLAAGRAILSTGIIPQLDIFSYTVPFREWIDLHWLFQVLIYSSYKVLALYGPLLVRNFMVLMIFAVLFRFNYEKKTYFINLVLCFLVLLVAKERFLTRPGTFTLFFLVLYSTLVFTRHGKGDKRLYWIPLIHLVWSNMHALSVLGLAFLALYTGGEIITAGWDYMLKRKERAMERFDQVKILIIVGIICFLISFINPYFHRGVFFPLVLFRQIGESAPVYIRGIGEFQSPFSPFTKTQTIFAFKFWAAVSAAIFILNLRNIRLSRLLIYGAFFYLTFKARRNIVPFALVSYPITVLNLKELLKYPEVEFIRSKINWPVIYRILRVIMLVVIIFYMWYVSTNRYYARDRSMSQFGFGLTDYHYAVGALNFIEAQNIPGRVYNDNGGGGYFLWRFYPERKVFSDGRMEVYPADFLEKTKVALATPEGLKEMTDEYNVNYFILRHGSGEAKTGLKTIWDSPDWSLVYLDSTASVFVKNTEENAELINKFAIDNAELTEFYENNIDASTPTSREAERSGILGALDALKEFLNEFPPKFDIPVREFSRATFADLIERFDLAEAEYKKCIEIFPEFHEIFNNLATIYKKQGRFKEATKYYLETLRYDPKNPKVWNDLAVNYIDLGMKRQAIEAFKRSLEINDDLLPTHYNLAMLYFEVGRPDLSEMEIKEVLRINPTYKPALRLLRNVRKRRAA